LIAAAIAAAPLPASVAGPALATLGVPFEGDVVMCLRQAEDAMVALGIEVGARYPGAIAGENGDVSYFITCDLPGLVVISVAAAGLSPTTNIRLLNQFEAAF